MICWCDVGTTENSVNVEIILKVNIWRIQLSSRSQGWKMQGICTLWSHHHMRKPLTDIYELWTPSYKRLCNLSFKIIVIYLQHNILLYCKIGKWRMPEAEIKTNSSHGPATVTIGGYNGQRVPGSMMSPWCIMVTCCQYSTPTCRYWWVLLQ